MSVAVGQPWGEEAKAKVARRTGTSTSRCRRQVPLELTGNGILLLLLLSSSMEGDGIKGFNPSSSGGRASSNSSNSLQARQGRADLGRRNSNEDHSRRCRASDQGRHQCWERRSGRSSRANHRRRQVLALGLQPDP